MSSYSLELMAAPAAHADPAALAAWPGDVPTVWENAGLLINHGLLTAEILGIDTTELTWRLDAIWAVPAEVLRALDEEDAQVMDQILGQVEAALIEALDDEGAAKGELGARLAASTHVRTDRHQRLYILGNRLDVRDLRRELGPFRGFLRLAAEQGHWLRIVE